MTKQPNIASGDPLEVIAALGKPKAERPQQGQSAAEDPLMFGGDDQMQGQQTVEYPEGQPNHIRADESLRPAPAAEKPDGELPTQAPAGDADDLMPSIVPAATPGSRKP